MIRTLRAVAVVLLVMLAVGVPLAQRALAQGISVGGKDRCYNLSCVVGSLTSADFVKASTYVQTFYVKDGDGGTRTVFSSGGPTAGYNSVPNASTGWTFDAECAGGAGTCSVAKFYERGEGGSTLVTVNSSGGVVASGQVQAASFSGSTTTATAGGSAMTGDTNPALTLNGGTTGAGLVVNGPSGAANGIGVTCHVSGSTGWGCVSATAYNGQQGVWGHVAGGSGAGVLGSNAGSGDAVQADSSAGTGYALNVKPDTTSPVKAAIHIDPQNADPSSPSAGDIYMLSSSGNIKTYAGSSWAVIPRKQIGSGTVNIASTTAPNCNTGTITVTGATGGLPTVCGYPTGVEAGIWQCWNSSSNTVTFRFCPVSGTVDPASGTFYAEVTL